jgi:hypothetical protein
MASRRSSWGGAMETYWAAPAAARDHVAALGRPSTVCVPVGSARIAQGGAQQHGDHEASITPIVGCQPDFGCQSIVGCTDCPAGKHSLLCIRDTGTRSADGRREASSRAWNTRLGCTP